MTDAPRDPGLPGIADAVAAPKRRRSLQIVWLVPIISALIGGWIAVKFILEHGPTITITFKSAEGLEAGKTKVKYKNVDVGEVKSIVISPKDLSRVIVTVEMKKESTPYLVEDMKFWVVKPRIAGGQVTGIGTLFSGAYIEVDLGKSTKPRREFEGLEVQPIITGDVPGRQFTLHGPDLGSHDIGTPVLFRRVQVGKVVANEIDKDGSGVTLKIFVEAPYDKFVNPNTRFWDASGVDVTADSTGIRVETESLLSILLGGIAFATPADAPPSQPADEHTVFILFPDRDLAMKRPDKEIVPFSVVFTESLRGLSTGAPVEFNGLPLGEVKTIGAEYDMEGQTFRFPVEIALYPDRLSKHFKPGKRAREAGLTIPQLIDQLIERGLRAQLKTGNLLTGQMFVALDFFPDAAKAKADWTKHPPELPTTPGGLKELQHTLASFAKKLDKVPLDKIAVDLRQALQSMHKMLQSTDLMVRRLDNELAPKAKETLEESRKALVAAERTLAADAPLQQDAREALRQLGRASQSLRLLADYLERHPESLLRGKREEGQ
jgi:paraquat-inducible protein B